MKLSRPRSVLLRTGAAAAILVGTLIPAPAQAAPLVTVEFDQNMTIGGSGSPEKRFQIFVNSTVTSPKLTMDFSGIAGIATGRLYDHSGEVPCIGTTVVVCTLTNYETKFLTVALTTKASPVVADGATGTFSYTATATGAAPYSAVATVTVATDGPDLGLNKYVPPPTPLQPGDRTVTPARFSNYGNKPAAAISVVFNLPTALIPDQFSNCSYADWAEFHRTLVSCELTDLVVAPGESVELVDDEGNLIAATVAPSAHGPLHVSITVDTAETAAELPKSLSLKPGAGKALKAVKVNSAGRRSVDVDQKNNLIEWTLEVENTSDYATLGAVVTGVVGDQVVVDLGAKNIGPAARGGHGEPVFSFYVKTPEWADVVSVPERCVAYALDSNGAWVQVLDSKAGQRYYSCTPPSTYAAPGDSSTLPFTLKIKALTGANGIVSFDEKTLNPGYTYIDANAANDKADISLASSTGVPTSPTASPTSGPTGGPTSSPTSGTEGAGGTGGGLPVTGTQVTLIAGGGALLAALGVALFVLSRRRRISLTDEA